MAEIGIGLGVLVQRDQIGLDAEFAMNGVAEQIVVVPGLGATTLDVDAGAGLDERAVAALFGLAKEASDAEMLPFSIFDSMPVEIPAEVPSSATVSSSSLRSFRTSLPICDSSELLISAGALEPVSRSSTWRVFGFFGLAFTRAAFCGRRRPDHSTSGENAYFFSRKYISLQLTSPARLMQGISEVQRQGSRRHVRHCRFVSEG
jgi:hypothetical protein